VLPCLSHGNSQISGFGNIVSYLERQTSYTIDDDLTSPQRADSIACTSYLATRGSALIALALYVSTAAWVETTRPAYSQLLRFPLTWTIPPLLRAEAVRKVDQLGLSHLADAVEDVDTPAAATATATSTGFLRLPTRLGPSSALRPEQASAIRLQTLADDFFATLEELRGQKQFFLRDRAPSSVDFLVYGYLCLMRVETPHPFLRKAMDGRHQHLATFYPEMHLVPLENWKTKLEDLPWHHTGTSIARTLGIFADGSIENIPGVGESWKSWKSGTVGTTDGADTKNMSSLLPVVGAATSAAIALGASLLFMSAPFGAPVHRFEPTKEEKVKLHHFGELGAMLEGLP
jgi:sorting and assembly machinery component 37